MTTYLDWADYGLDERGSFIRYFITRTHLLPKTNSKEREISTDQLKFSFKAKEYPTFHDMREFRHLLITSMPGVYDNMNINIRNDVNDEDLGKIAGDYPTLRGDRTNYDSQVGDPDARESGLARKALKRKAGTDAITDPKAFMKQRDDEIKIIDGKSLAVYRQSLDIYLHKYKYPEDDAKKKATADMKAYRDRLMDKLNEIYDDKKKKKAEKHLVTV